ncbi:hypothetical protein CK203_107922 [Vitis vinifera]|uniref:Uncharacterized protein n=1 Tax=Vitis vinifera TaxID=29760 RepID=A0A438DCT9_VITVI|nr:hypothetical protein CK203_107922 [Vitis vinifera]
MKWSPQDAMKAYLHTLQLEKKLKFSVWLLKNLYHTIDRNQMGLAAKHTKARFICILRQLQDIEDYKAQLSCYNLKDVAEFVHGNPCEVIMGFKNIDFAVIDCKFEDYMRLFKIIDMNPRGSIVVVSNLERRRNGASFGEVIKGGKELNV